MAKEPENQNNGSITIAGPAGWRAKIPAAAVTTALLAALGAWGYNGLEALRLGSTNPALAQNPEFVRLENRLDSHCAQQDKDDIRQEQRDTAQERHVEAVNSGVNMLNQGMSAMQAQLETLQTQMSTVERDIKELLRRQGFRGGNSQ